MSRAVHVRITGVVQGVGYRAWTEREAMARGLSGWVRNRRDGSVEAVIAGEDDMVEQMSAAFWIGPPSGEVDNVVVEPAETPQAGFCVLPTV